MSSAAGLLIFSGIICGIFSVVPYVEGIEYLSESAPHGTRVLIGAVFQFLLVPIYFGFALFLYPILRRYNKSLAIGFVSFRLLSCVFQIIGVILLPLFILLSSKYLSVSNPDTSTIETLGEILKLGRDLTNHMGVMLATGLGNLILFYIFIKYKLAPLWLSYWGLLGNILAMFTSFLILFDAIDVISSTFIAMTIPLVIQEIVLAIWLIKKGLNSYNSIPLKN
ncbi:DUF4386 domain-containing protein [Reinekea marina]|nr:DUF4386 domain-containing protein [Reinekea marina]MDN3649842.1 DUF4386 domain-containing protein [Reinekea marina]